MTDDSTGGYMRQNAFWCGICAPLLTSSREYAFSLVRKCSGPRPVGLRSLPGGVSRCAKLPIAHCYLLYYPHVLC
jgi:hypothetical protein